MIVAGGGNLLATTPPDNLPEIIAISHASAVVEWDEATVFVDPVGEQSQYAPYGTPDIVVLTHIRPESSYRITTVHPTASAI